MIKITILILALLNGGWMIFDGIYVIKTGKYFGPTEPGIWSKLVRGIGINPFAIGPVFIFLGTRWLGSVAGVLSFASWGWLALLISAIATLWYIKIGTIISVMVIMILVTFKSTLGYV